MCSQYEIHTTQQKIGFALGRLMEDNLFASQIDEHIYPFSNSFVITSIEDRMKLSMMRYSLTPYWSSQERPKFVSYNARLDRVNRAQLEHIYQAPTWKVPFQRQRCLVPISSFIESCQSGTHEGNLVRFSATENELLFAAGIYDSWLNPVTKQRLDSFAIITDEPNDFLLQVGHDRQPVFLSSEEQQIWLNVNNLPPTKAYEFLKSNQRALNYQVEILRPLQRTILAEQQPSLF